MNSVDTEPYKTQELILKHKWIYSLDLKTYWKKTLKHSRFALYTCTSEHKFY